jgi:hypothetical protein
MHVQRIYIYFFCIQIPVSEDLKIKTMQTELYSLHCEYLYLRKNVGVACVNNYLHRRHRRFYFHCISKKYVQVSRSFGIYAYPSKCMHDNS